MNLFRIELKRIFRSILYWILILLLAAQWYMNIKGITAEEIRKTRMVNKESVMEMERPLLRKPTEKDNFFGMKCVENPGKIMRGGVNKLMLEYEVNTYAYYPFGYYKAARLDEGEQRRVLAILCEITGLTEEELKHIPDTYFPKENGAIINMTKVPDGEEQKSMRDISKVFTPQVTYETFKRRMAELEKMIGKHSSYSLDSLIMYFGLEERSYGEADEEFRTMITKDRITGGFSRYFCDMMTLPLGVLPAFIAVFIWLKDKSTSSSELWYSKKIHSVKLIFSRYSASVVLILVPVFLLSFESLIPLAEFGEKEGMTVDYLAYLKYIVWWLLPTLMIVSAIGCFLTVLTDSPVAILVQFMWWLVDGNQLGKVGNYSMFQLMIRHNSLIGYDVIQRNFKLIMYNRIFYTVLSVLVLLFTVWILEQKRRGSFDVWNALKRSIGSAEKKLRTAEK